MTATEKMVKEHLKASRKAAKKALTSKRRARAFLVRAGIVKKNGKGLSKPYR